MDRIWSPWRYQYVTTASPSDRCIFCAKVEENKDEENLVLFRGSHNFVMLNLYPYTNGHIMIAPYLHVASLEEAPAEALSELMSLAQNWERRLREVYKAPGYNIGMNIGECAGAGVAGHIHLHMLPRWPADSNFMTVVGETRVMPEDLATTYRKLKPA